MDTYARRVLVVDDEPSVCGLIKLELMPLGFHCTTTTDGLKAKTLLTEQDFAFLIADIRMPRMSGLDLLACVNDHQLRCKVILISGSSDRERLSQAIQLGAYDCLDKPFSIGELVEVMGKATDQASERPALIDRAAEALEQTSQMREVALESVRALVHAVEAKDPYTKRHSEQVAHYAMNFADVLALPRAFRETVRVAALLHDVGKIGVPDEILTKAGPLTEEEFVHVRRHPVLGADILANITVFSAEAALVRHHHERWDGNGYPDRLSGEESPLGSRIVQVADSIDAMLMNRTYKKGYGVERMLEELTRCAGTQFDPALASSAEQWCRCHGEELILPGRTGLLASRGMEG